MADSSYRSYQRRTEARRLGRYIPDHDAELDGGHAKIHGREGGGIIVTHVLDSGEQQEHIFEPHEYDNACNHLHELIRPDFNEPKGESTDEKY